MMRKILLVSGLLAVPGVAQAHLLGGNLSVTDGLLHPLTGMDHLGAAIAIGLLAARREGIGALLLPVTFTLALIAGVLLSGAGAQAGLLAESGVIASAVLLLGFAAMRIDGAGLLLAVTIAAGLMHGHVHGAGLDVSQEGPYLAGLIAATMAIQAGAFLVARRGVRMIARDRSIAREI
jgi:urease accessory protein